MSNNNKNQLIEITKNIADFYNPIPTNVRDEMLNLYNNSFKNEVHSGFMNAKKQIENTLKEIQRELDEFENENDFYRKISPISREKRFNLIKEIAFNGSKALALADECDFEDYHVLNKLVDIYALNDYTVLLLEQEKSLKNFVGNFADILELAVKSGEVPESEIVLVKKGFDCGINELLNDINQETKEFKQTYCKYTDLFNTSIEDGTGQKNIK